MPYYARKETAGFEDAGVVDRTHPPVIATRKVAADVTTMSAGTILMETDDGVTKYVAPEDDSTVVIVGVSTQDYDAATGDLVNVLRHGTVVRDLLDATDEEIADLEAQTHIYAL